MKSFLMLWPDLAEVAIKGSPFCIEIDGALAKSALFPTIII